MLFALHGEHDNSSHSKPKEMKLEASSAQQQQGEASNTQQQKPKPLFQVLESSSTSTSAPLFETKPSTSKAAPLFTIPDTPTTYKTVAAVTAAAASEAEQLTPLWATAASTSSSPTTTATASVTSGHSSASNSQSSFTFASQVPPSQPQHTGLNNTNYFRSSSSSTTTTTTMNVNLLGNVNPSAPRRNTMQFGGTHSSTPDLFTSNSTDTGIPFPTLHQVKQQSQSQSLRRMHMTGRSKEGLTDKQKATLDRVARLSCRMTDGVQVAVVSNLGADYNSSRGEEASILAHYGLNEIASWRAQAMRVLQSDPEVQRSSGLAFYEHLPLQSRGRTIGSLTLSSSQFRAPLSPDERQDLEDLTFLATQALVEGPPSSQPRMTRQVSNHDHDYATSTPRSASAGRTRRSSNSDSPMTMMETIDGSHSTSHYHHDDHSEDESHMMITEEDPSKCIIACTAHDLLTPLMGLQLSLSLLQEDAKFVRHLEEQPLQRESFWTAWQSTEVMFRMCQTTIDTLRANKERQLSQQSSDADPTALPTTPVATEICNLDITVLLQSLQRLMDPIPKQVPLIMTLQGKIPNQVPIVTTSTKSTTPMANGSSASANTTTVDWHILRCALTVLSHACRASSQDASDDTISEPIQLRIGVVDERLVLECNHNCPQDSTAVQVEDDLALQSVALQMQAVHGGQHGFARQSETRAVFWFSVPVGSGMGASTRDDRVITLLPQHQQQQQDSSIRSGMDDLPGLAPMMMDCSEPAQKIRRDSPPSIRSRMALQKTQKSLSPKIGGGRLRKLRRSSTGSTNTLGNRRRTFHDMDGLREEAEYMPPTLSTNCLPQMLPNMIKAQSTIVGPSYRPLAGIKRNYQFPSQKKIRLRENTTAHSAMQAAFHAGLDSVNGTGFGEQKRYVSFSLLQEEQQVQKERLQPWMMSASDRSHSSNAEKTAPGGGLDRCFKDLMGTSAMAVDNVRERLYNRASSTSSSTGSAPPKPSLPSSQRERKALVIEDSLVIRKTVARALTRLGIQTVVQANDGLEGIARMKEDVFDITLCDFSMPNLGGIDCVKQYRQWEKQQSLARPKQYIVGMSAHASPNDIGQGLKVGMNEYHPKPLTIKKLTELLESSPLQQARSELDREWQRKQGLSVESPSPATTTKPSLFADFTKSAVNMLDAMNGSGRSSINSVTYSEDAVQSKRPNTAPLFSVVS